MIIEICCTSQTSVTNAIDGGASRLELCENLLDDGLTPSSKFLKDVLNQTPITVHVLIRPRPGNFFYTPEEVKTATAQIKMAKSLGAKGIVMGALKANVKTIIYPTENQEDIDKIIIKYPLTC